MVLLKTQLLLSFGLVVLLACQNAGSKSNVAPVAPATDKNSFAIPEAELISYRNKVTPFVDSLFRYGSLNGSVLVAKNGQVIYERYEGKYRYRQTSDSIQPNSSFHLASVSKTITAVSVLSLIQDGKLTLETDLVTIFPQWPLQGVTIRTLLNHRSGLPNYVHYMEVLGWDKKQRITNQAVLDFIVARHAEIDIARPDKGFNYSNTNYALLALVVEKISGSSFQQFVKQRIFDPLDMKDSFVFSISDSATAMPSYFYNGRQYAFDFLDLVYGDKNIYSTVRDLMKFDHALNEGSLLNDTLQLQAYTPYSNEKPGTHNYGLGWRMLLMKNGKKLIYHNGWWHGNRTAFYRLIDEDVTIIALCNNDSRRVYDVKKLADIFGNYFQRGNTDEENEVVRVAPKTKRIKKSSRNLASRNKTLSRNTRHTASKK